MGIFYHAPPPTQAAAHVPIPAQGDQPPRASIVNTMQVAGYWPREYEPALYSGNFSRVKIAPLTLVYGDQPPRRSSSMPWSALASWVDNGQAQSSAPQAAWNVPTVLAPVPPTGWPWEIWRAWQDDETSAAIRHRIAPLTSIYGDAPPPLSRSERKSIEAWFAFDGHVSMPIRNAAWNISVVVEPVPPPRRSWQIWYAWHEEQTQPSRWAALAPLTLIYGDQPPPRVLTAPWQVLRSYRDPDGSSQTAAPTAAWNIPPVAPGDAPPLKSSISPWQAILSWFEPTWPEPHAVPFPIVSAFPSQFSGFSVFYAGAEKELSLVAEADAPSGMGGKLKLRKNGMTYAIYLVETTDRYASDVFVHTPAGIKAIRLKT